MAENEEGRWNVTPERWQEVKAILAGALERAPEERHVYLDQACTEPALRREVQSLIDAHEQAETTFMGQPLVGAGKMLKNGTKLGPYEILARIGAGGMGVVYRARDGRLEREVAVKILSPGLLTDEAARKRFRKEALALAKLNHPNIATVHDVGEQDGTDYLVMECVPGQSLAEEARSGAVAEKDAVALGVQIAAALEEAHEQGIVHRDLKPANIMVTPKRQAKVLDFGLAKILRPLGEASATESFTQTQNLAGTLPYMAPEQLKGERADARTDIHALGAVLFETVTGKRLYQEDSVPQLTDAILHQQPVAPRALNARVSPEMERIVLKCLEKEPENRYQSAKELGVDLRRLSAPSTATMTTAARPATRRVGLPVASAVLVAVGLALGGWLFFARKAHALTDKDTIVLADFTNTTGDPVFDGALRQGLSVQLEQTPFLKLVEGDQVAQTLKMMERPLDTRLTPELAREVCQRMNSTVEIDGSIASLGSQYVLGLNALNCRTGETLAQEQVTADGKEKVLPALGGATSQLRSKLGESQASLAKFDVPLTQATTSSLEALKAYNQGSQAVWAGNWPSAMSWLKRATEIDPDFATAYSVLATIEQQLGDSKASEGDETKAYRLLDRTSAYEKMVIPANYYFLVVRDYDKAAVFEEEWAHTFPRDSGAWVGLGITYGYAGRYDQALAAESEALRLNPSAFSYGMTALDYMILDRTVDARATIDKARANHIEPFLSHPVLYQIALVSGDQAAMNGELANSWTDVAPGTREEARSDTEAYHGRLTAARDSMQRAIAEATVAKLDRTIATYQVESAVRDVLYGDFAQAKVEARKYIGPSVDRDMRGGAAVALALAADPGAERVADDLVQRFPDSSYCKFVLVPSARAALAIAKGDPKRAIDTLAIPPAYELVSLNTVGSLMPVYLRGQAYLADGRASDALAEFQKLLDHPLLTVGQATGALVYLEMGRAYKLQGDTAKARESYQKFLTLWKDADPDIPILKQAQAEYAKLR